MRKPPVPIVWPAARSPRAQAAGGPLRSGPCPAIDAPRPATVQPRSGPVPPPVRWPGPAPGALQPKNRGPQTPPPHPPGQPSGTAPPRIVPCPAPRARATAPPPVRVPKVPGTPPPSVGGTAQPRRLPFPAGAPASVIQRAAPAAAPAAPPPLIAKGGWQKILDQGTYNGSPVFIHYTSLEGARAILQDKRITDKKRGEKREGSKPGIYVNPPGQQFNPGNAEILLFLGNERYIGSADYAVVFAWDSEPEDLGPVTEDSWVKEYKMHGDITLSKDNILYLGPNPFKDVFS